MTALCAVYMIALKVLNMHKKFEMCSLAVPEIIAIGVLVGRL